MAKEFSRTQRIADQIQKELAVLIQLEIKDPRLGMVTVSSVDVSRDLAYANIYVTFLGKEDQVSNDEQVAVLNKAAGFLRSMLAKRLTARTTPQLRFFFDESIQRGQYLSKLIDDAVSKDRNHHDKGVEEE
ncbi:30S ribosome-binding factor RbfA [Zooshikella marina]|uniref:Ribosome-binding factor A n=1 Tax=Zooshikella ganghwensis TaxID=202772 RepID=A0A4P9VU19_9GAMM|nr:30S ribosome-binding factor RbfA [Zooshikella ganghwensis]MBU2707987.1 30S ribosome-binding factor RbfA [Zooshikella ganghwensis]RDH45782.1 30S ribosome-binding factor RbfA [Zooshikella ganghwensis]